MKYIIGPNGSFVSEDELYHYGVKGMRWGVRRNTKLLNSSDSAKRAKAASALKKHREKGTAEIAKLKKKGVKLEKAYEEKIIKNENRAAKLNSKAASKRRRAYGLFVSGDKAKDYIAEAEFLETKANYLTAKANEAKAKINKNKAMVSAFEREVGNIDTAFANVGRKYVNR